MASGTRHDELALGVVALEALAQIRLVQLARYARTGHELRQIPFDAFQQTAAHEPRGTNGPPQRDAQVRNARQSTKHSTYIIHLLKLSGSFNRPDQGIPR